MNLSSMFMTYIADHRPLTHNLQPTSSQPTDLCTSDSWITYSELFSIYPKCYLSKSLWTVCASENPILPRKRVYHTVFVSLSMIVQVDCCRIPDPTIRSKLYVNSGWLPKSFDTRTSMRRRTFYSRCQWFVRHFIREYVLKSSNALI